MYICIMGRGVIPMSERDSPVMWSTDVSVSDNLKPDSLGLLAHVDITTLALCHFICYAALLHFACIGSSDHEP